MNVASRDSLPLTTVDPHLPAAVSDFAWESSVVVLQAAGTEVSCVGLTLLDNLLQAVRRHLSPVSVAARSVQ